MKIKKVDDKPMVIHTKKKAKIHMHEPKKAKIKGSNIYTVQRGPKIASAKINDTGKKKSYRKSTIHQAEKKEKEPSKFKRNIRESNTSIKTKNTNLHIAGRTGALAAGAVTEQVEGGQEVSQAAYLAYEVIDEEAAKVVVEIFSLIIAGYNASEVARILNERKIPTRVQNQWKNGINYVPVHNKGDYMWDNSEVIAIVQNEQYKGIMIQNKCETVGFGDNKKVRKRNKEDWSVVEGAIPRIVSDEMFDEVNKMLRVEARGIEKSTKKRKKNLFICPYCGRKLMNSSAVCTPKLLCPKRRMVRTGECQQIFMLKSEAQDKVLEITKEICRTLIQEEELKRASKDKRKVTSDEYLISELKAEYDRISNSTVSCYQSYREGKYTKEEYVQLRKTNQELLADLENQISDLQEKAANQEPDTEEKIEQLTQYSMLEQYDGDVLSNIIDKVLIYNDKDIEVVFKGENFIRNAV